MTMNSGLTNILDPVYTEINLNNQELIACGRGLAIKKKLKAPPSKYWSAFGPPQRLGPPASEGLPSDLAFMVSAMRRSHWTGLDPVSCPMVG